MGGGGVEPPKAQPPSSYATAYHHAKYGGDPGSRAGCRQKSVMFFVCLFFVTRFHYHKLPHSKE